MLEERLFSFILGHEVPSIEVVYRERSPSAMDPELNGLLDVSQLMKQNKTNKFLMTRQSTVTILQFSRTGKQS